jgi:hypothetical protein
MKVGRGVAVENKALLLLTAEPSMKQRLIEKSTQLGATLLQRIESSSKCVNVIARIARDPFAPSSKLPGHDVTIELRAEAEFAALTHAIAGAGSELPSASTDPAATVVLVGTDYGSAPAHCRPCAFSTSCAGDRISPMKRSRGTTVKCIPNSDTRPGVRRATHNCRSTGLHQQTR